MASWVANHRVVTRVALVVVDVGLLVLCVTGLHSSGRHWVSFLVLFAWLLLTAAFGWGIPRQVDAWRQRDGTLN
jgi:hypothetical protein